jgi:hypothetical protein
LMPRYKMAEGQVLSHSEKVDVVIPTYPKPTTAVGYEGRMLKGGDEIELSESAAKHLLDVCVLEARKASRRRSRK